MSKCEHCGGAHIARCPDVKAIEYDTSGRIKRVEYFTNAEKFATYPPYPLYPAYPITTYPPYPLYPAYPITLPPPAFPYTTTNNTVASYGAS